MGRRDSVEKLVPASINVIMETCSQKIHFVNTEMVTLYHTTTHTTHILQHIARKKENR